jgi:acetylornithine deacetylase/succinyl-diaminopimelate desuccinylase-like protein
MNALQITQALVAIPTAQNQPTRLFEQDAALFIEAYLRDHHPWLRLTRQEIGDGRFNVVAKSGGEPQLLLAGHLDTVELKTGWRYNHAGEIVGDRFYGVGAIDMKSGIACILAALEGLKPVDGLTLLFYCDEEYDFKGMRHFIANEKSVGRLAAVAEPTDLRLSTSMRGLIEIKLAVTGRTGHAARPTEGINALDMLYKAVAEVRGWLCQFDDEQLKQPVSNLAWVHGGVKLPQDDGPFTIGCQGNNIADYAEAVFEVRPTRPELRAAQLVDQFIGSLEGSGCQASSEVRHDLGSMNTDRDMIANVVDMLREVLSDGADSYAPAKAASDTIYKDPTQSGYGDGQMVAERYGIPVFEMGPVGGNMHGADEWVDIPSLDICTAFYARLIKETCR